MMSRLLSVLFFFAMVSAMTAQYYYGGYPGYGYGGYRPYYRPYGYGYRPYGYGYNPVRGAVRGAVAGAAIGALVGK